MNRLEYAKLVRAGKIAPRSRKLRDIEEADSPKVRTRQPSNTFQPTPAGEEQNPVYQRPDSWIAPPAVQRGVTEGDDPSPRLPSGPKRSPSHKRRGGALSISASEEERFLLRKYAFEQGESFSQWARVTLFKAAGLTIPPRK